MHRFIAICLCLSLILIAGCSSQSLAEETSNKQYTEIEKYAEDISDHAMSISAQLKLIDKDIASDMDSSLKTAAIETNTAVLRMHLSKARDITPRPARAGIVAAATTGEEASMRIRPPFLPSS